ncbi:MAG: replication-associated recombination protein A, partial [Pseudomonadales bacterium]|nr:replication-associated recombination protein A [Pseudomonadales bacterium]
MRPDSIEHYVGQEHILGKDCPLSKALEAGHLHSMILWGPPGTGKTTLAYIIANSVDAHFISISAVLSGVKEIRGAIEQARQQASLSNRKTILFVDEVHRFNKSQQDAFLPFVEDGTVVFIGATTENPSFELNNALLSRARVYTLKSLNTEDIKQVLIKALATDEVLVNRRLFIAAENLELLAMLSDGDARRALNFLEILADLAETDGQKKSVSDKMIYAVATQGARRFDKGGDIFYEQISALHKSVRGSAVDAALYWLGRMLDGGCDPVYIARRLTRMASEDIGNADPRALQLALNAWDVQERLGSPEGELALAQAVLYLASAPKSNAVYKAFNAMKHDVKSLPSYEVPLHLRNAPTKLLKELGFGKEYQYAHDFDNAF